MANVISKIVNKTLDIPKVYNKPTRGHCNNALLHFSEQLEESWLVAVRRSGGMR